MSIVGTRPPLISETNLYEPHHKVRLTLKQVVAYLIYSKKRSMDIELSALQLLHKRRPFLKAYPV